jgi:hypothetical protein
MNCSCLNRLIKLLRRCGIANHAEKRVLIESLVQFLGSFHLQSRENDDAALLSWFSIMTEAIICCVIVLLPRVAGINASVKWTTMTHNIQCD